MSIGPILFCLVVGITDGDTLTARCDGISEEIKVRLAEIDAPEKSQPWGKRSKESLSEICHMERSELQVINRDRYGRVVARTICNGTDSSREQIRRGMAWVYDKYAKDIGLYQIQGEAQISRRGLWSDPAPIPPWKYRKRKA